MLKQPTIDKLHELRLSGMARALEEQTQSTDYDDLSFMDRLALLVDREFAERDSNRMRLRLKQVKGADAQDKNLKKTQLPVC